MARNGAAGTARTGPDLGVPFEQCFASAKSSKLICEWLDRTFNGDLLPLADKRYRHFFTGLGGDADTVFGCLTNVLYRAPDGQLPIAETWSAIDFAHVPVGLLSEVYEQFAHEHGPLLDASAPRSRKLARVESIHYTPHRIAKFMVEEALAATSATSSERGGARAEARSVGSGTRHIASGETTVRSATRRASRT